MSIHNVKIVQNLLEANSQVADVNRRRLADAGILAVNIIASPGAGKTSLIVKTLACLGQRVAVGVIEGDIAGSIDTEKVLDSGARDAVQINTGGNCHLEAGMIKQALDRLDLTALDIVFIENVGNLICPNHFVLGEKIKLCLSSMAEGHDKPVKYPDIFAQSDVIVLNKIDLMEMVDFERKFFYDAVRALNQKVPIFEVSCRLGTGIEEWTEWLLEQRGFENLTPCPFPGREGEPAKSGFASH